MADLSDVENALLTIIQGAVYPSGTSNPSIVAAQVSIGRGWPLAADIDTAMAAGKCIVSVFSSTAERNTTRYHRDDVVVTLPVHTLTASVSSGNRITIGGTVSRPQNVLALCGAKYVFSYAVQAGDTLNTIAAGLAALIAVQFPGTAAAGAVVTVTGNPGILQARIAAQGTVWTEQGRQQRGFQISCWCPTPAMRDILAPAIDLALRQEDFITLADQSAARLRYECSHQIDSAEKVQIYRRDLVYMVEYATATTLPAYEVGAIGVTITGGVSPDGTNPNVSAPAQTTYY